MGKILLDSQFLEEDLVAHFCIFEHFVPAYDFHVEIDVTNPEEPAESVRHGLEIFLAIQPGFDFRREVTHYVAEERRVLSDEHLAPFGRLVFAVADVVHVANDLLNRVLA